jgi:hypothetical protein
VLFGLTHQVDEDFALAPTLTTETSHDFLQTVMALSGLRTQGRGGFGIRLADSLCAYDGALSARWKSVPEKSHISVAESNCVTMRWGGKQLEANDRSAGARTRFGGMVRRACNEVVKPETHRSR